MNVAELARVDEDAPASTVRKVPRSWLVTKRATDIVVSLSALVLTSPLLLVSMAVIVLTSPGSPIFMQERVGENGRRFKMMKLRTMVDGAHLMLDDVRHLNEADGPVFKTKNDPRLHALGSVLRRASIDELPNFVNVLIGDMSVVGPRPPLPQEVDHYDERAMVRLSMKPGITCLWQINGRSHTSFDEWVEMDRRYIETWTPTGDLAIIARTIPAVIRGDGAH